MTGVFSSVFPIVTFNVFLMSTDAAREPLDKVLALSILFKGLWVLLFTQVERLPISSRLEPNCL